jgi:hypothetical protein
MWRFIFDPASGQLVLGRLVDLHTMPDYDRLIFYGTTCNAWAREDEDVRALLSPSACDRRPLWHGNPWCRTHQLVGLRFVEKNRCESDEETAVTVRTIEDRIRDELSWDFRVEDAYIQRALLLVESGRGQDVKPVWIRRILDAQRADGGWDGADVLAPLPGGKVLGWSSGSLYPQILSPPASNFHATAQALYLLALLLGQAAQHSPTPDPS